MVIPAIVIGLSARASGLSIDCNQCLLTEYIQSYCPSWITLIFNCGLLIAVVSTADSLICSISSLCVYDFFESEKLSEKNQMRLSQLATLILGASGMLLSLFFTDIVSMLIVLMKWLCAA